MPQAAPEPGAVCGPKSSDQSDKKEEHTNYEINSKTVATTRNSYKIERLSIAVVVNKGRVAQMVGEPVDEAKIDAYLAEMQKRSEEHTSELQSLMRISYAVFCLKKKK